MSLNDIRCFVPNCENTVGILLPSDEEKIENIRAILNIQKEILVDSSNYICMQHYEQTLVSEISDELGETLDEDADNDTEVQDIQKPVKTKTVENEEGPNKVTVLPEEDIEETLCRLCMKTGGRVRNVFEDLVDEQVPIVVVILACIHPLEISKNDNLPQQICVDCLETVRNYFKFRSQCLQVDNTLRQQFKRIPQKRKSRSTSNKKKKLTRYDKSLDSDGDYKNRNVISPPLLEPFKTVMNQKSEVDEKFDKVEEELRQVFEESEAENIIIHVENDDEDSENTEENKITSLTELKLPIVIKPVSPKTPLTKNKKLIPSSSKLGRNVYKNSKREEFKSNIGIYEGIPCSYVFDLEFCAVDGYLFEYRLSKGNLRYLRCILPSCPSTALQEKIKDDLYSNAIKVRKAHNHKKPLTEEKKKQMFLHVMRRKLQSDKGLNFRSVYDEVCQLDPDMKVLVPLKNVINEICRNQLSYKIPPIHSFEQFYNSIEDDGFQKLQFTHNGKQFYRDKFIAEDNSRAVVFANSDTINQVSDSQLMYVDASFKIDTNEKFKYQLVTVLVWVEDSYYPILFVLVSSTTQAIYKKVFQYLHNILAPKLRPTEIVTDYEANLFHALAETYLTSSIGGSVFYYTQNLYKKVCSLKLSRDLETNSYFRNIYHMLLMLPLLPVNTIMDGLDNMETQAKDLGISSLIGPIFEHVRKEWIARVTPDLFCVHRLENRINENVIAPFKKLRDFIMLSKGKMQKQSATIVTVVEKLIELEYFLNVTYSAPTKRSFARDLSSSQKKNVLRAWQYIESHPKININNFFTKVLGYIKCMENQLWIWGFYRYTGDADEELINANNFSIACGSVHSDPEGEDQEGSPEGQDKDDETEYVAIEEYGEEEEEAEGIQEERQGQIVMEGVIDEHGGVVLESNPEDATDFEDSVDYVYEIDEKMEF